MKPLTVGLAGLGTVGMGVLRLLRENADVVAARAGRPIEVVAVSARDPARDRGMPVRQYKFHADPVALAEDPAVDAVVELIGGADGPALATVRRAIAQGRAVVTANKALLALHGPELAAAAGRAGVPLAYEASVAGGIPVVKLLREGLAANHIIRVAGILNGTCNYILSNMTAHGADFSASLAEAQRLGYAEANPAFDIEGTDTAHKLVILATLAFGRPVPFASVHVEGIVSVTALDILHARELGYRIKLLGIARRVDGGTEARVHPCLVPEDGLLARVDGVYNAVVADTDQAGRMLMQGRGAGAGPTASAVVADLIDVACGRTPPIFGFDGPVPEPRDALPIAAHVGPYYLRLMVRDRPGVIADVTSILRDEKISLASMLQRGRSETDAVPVVIITHEAREAAMRHALARIAALSTVLEPPALIRIEPG